MTELILQPLVGVIVLLSGVSVAISFIRGAFNGL